MTTGPGTPQEKGSRLIPTEMCTGRKGPDPGPLSTGG